MAEFTFEEQWSDVVPIPQDDGPNPVVKIAYSAEFTKMMDLFRGIVAKGEYSERVLELTEELLELNAANYTIWQYRRECLKSLKFDLNEELDYLDGFSRENPKNYQIWHHRRTIVEWLGCGERELKFCETVFDVDAKNYHAWAHRQWALKTFNLWDSELPFIEKCIKKDVRNNSAWNQRWFYVHQGPEMVTTELVQREIQYVWAALQDVTLNESAWNYLRGLARTHSEEARAAVKDRCREMVEQSQRQNALAMGLLADLCEEDATALMLVEGSTAGSQAGDEASPATAAAGSEHSGDCSAQQQGLQELRTAEKLCVQLVVQDAIRAKSWTRRVLDLRQRIAACGAALA